MATNVITDVRVGGGPRRLLEKTRTALAQGCRRGAAMVSVARHRYRRPALTIAGFGCIDAAAWHTFGMGAGLLVLGALFLVFEALGGDE